MDKIDHVSGREPLHTKLGSVASTHRYHHWYFLFAQFPSVKSYAVTLFVCSGNGYALFLPNHPSQEDHYPISSLPSPTSQKQFAVTSRPPEAPLEVSPKISQILGLKSAILNWHWHITWHISLFFSCWCTWFYGEYEHLIMSNTHTVYYLEVSIPFLTLFPPEILSFLWAASFVSSSHHILASGRSSHWDCVDSAKAVHPKWYIMWLARMWVCNSICEVWWWHENRGASVSAAMLMSLSPSPKICMLDQE